MRSNRWGYMRAPSYNPPNDDCPECVTPSKTYYMGGKTVATAATVTTAATAATEGVAPQTVHRWKCEHGHVWTVIEATPTR